MSLCWKDVISRVPEIHTCELHKEAADYYEHFYWGDKDWTRFTPEKVKEIVYHIYKDAKIKQLMKDSDERMAQLNKEFPWFKSYEKRLDIREGVKK
jgi:hypothetical protein